MAKNSNVGLVLPFYNEEMRFKEKYFDALAKMKNLDLILVNDGSIDGTLQLLNGFGVQHFNVQILNLLENQGKAEAVRKGLNFLNSKEKGYAFLGFLDSDGAIEIEDIKNLLGSLETYPIEIHSVVGSRINLGGRKISRRKIRYVFGRILHHLLLTGSGVRIWDTQCGIKFFKNTEDFKKVIQKPFSTSWLFDIEILLRLNVLGVGKDAHFEYPLLKWSEVGKSKLGRGEILNVIHDCASIYVQRWSLMLKKEYL